MTLTVGAAIQKAFRLRANRLNIERAGPLKVGALQPKAFNEQYN